MNDFEPKQFGKYLLLKKIAVGGMAEIYRAKTYGVDGFEKELVIKRILPHCSADKDFIDMLIREAKLTVLLSHANIVQVYDFSKVGDDYYIAMELIHGINLRDIMSRCREDSKPLATAIAVYVASEICKGLDYAHRKTDQNNKALNIIHRDISPQNILVSYEGEVKIVDFGIAKAQMNISHTLAGILKGKIAYMSPEQAMGKKVDNRTDIFSTGILLYEMLTGQKLFTGESQFEVLKKIRTTRITEEMLPQSIPDQLKPIVVKSLSYEMDGRYKTAGDMQIDLTKYLYTNHVDFSPRKLASFVKDLFAQELRAEQEFRAREASAEGLTSTMDIAEGAKQVSIVHRAVSTEDDTAKTEGPKEKYIETMVGPAGEEKAAGAKPAAGPPPRKKKMPPLGKIAATALIVAALGWVVYRFASRPEPAEPPEEVAATGSISVTSSPDEASVLLDGVDTGKKTPAWLEELETAKTYKIRVEKEGYSPAETSVDLKEPGEKTVTLMLAPASGTLEIVSEPSGASIRIDGRDTGKTTPSTFEKMALNSDIRILLSKADFEDFEQVINLTSPRPQRVSARLDPISPRLGRLSITSTPSGAQIFVDGKDTGRTTPAVIANLSAGKYDVALKIEGFEEWKESYEVAADREIPVKVSLARVGEPTPEPPPPVTPPPEEPEKPPITEPPPEPEPEKPAEEPAKPALGTLRVTSTPPGAQITLDGKSTGKKTPATLTDLKVGATYSVGLSLSGHQGATRRKHMAAESESLSVRLAAVEPPPPAPAPTPPPAEPPRVPTRVTPDDVYGELSLSSDPPAAQVIINGQAIPARTPVTIRRIRIDQPHTVTIQLPGYRPWTRSFTMDSKRKSLHAPLQPE